MPPISSEFLALAPVPKSDALHAIIGPDGLENNGPSTSMFTRIRSEPNLISSVHKRQTTMISIPSTYAGPYTPASVVVGAVLGAVGGFVLILGILFFTFGRTKINEAQSEVVWETARSRRSSSRRRHPPMREVVDPPESVSTRTREDDVIEVMEEDESYVESPRREHRPSGYRIVDPSGYGGRRTSTRRGGH
ncbi:hypothetical protein PRK78_000316 [Emydomyces testavorans]|uniref:Transmembrane protein n=1 Tax=Emydomyces testavorans TaxID=2070801 RepID=A0AAF0DB74_9EURO|nr:hypothetical protein PRK78_000316 [Emydomyces testavorans]